MFIDISLDEINGCCVYDLRVHCQNRNECVSQRITMRLANVDIDCKDKILIRIDAIFLS